MASKLTENMRFRPWLWAAAAVLAASLVPAQDGAPEVVAALRLDGSQTTFKMGEPVMVVISFTGAANRYVVNPIVYGGAPFPDKYFFTPADGVAKIYNESYGPDYLTTQPVSGTPVELRIPLNEWFRFDQPGHYSLKIESSRVFIPSRRTDVNRTPPVTTNSIEFDIVAMTPEDEAQEISRLKSQAAAASRTRGVWPAGDDPQKALTYLTGDVAARADVAAALRPAGSTPNLLRFPNRELVLRLLEEGYLQPGAFASEGVLKQMVALHSPKDKAEAARIMVEYLSQLAQSLPSKTDRPRMVAAQTILSHLKQNDLLESQTELAQPAIEVIREHLETSNFEYMFRAFWPQLRDPSLVPALERILRNPRLEQHGNSQERRGALTALFDLAPERAKPFVVAELQNPDGLRDVALLGRIPDAELPELDQLFLSRLQVGGSNLAEDTRVLARFASTAILPEVIKLYASQQTSWNQPVGMQVLAYLARRQGDEVLPLIRAAADHDLREHGTDLNTLGTIAECYFSDVVARLLREQLAGDDPKAASWAAYYLSKFGTRDDRALLESRLSRTTITEQLRRELTEGLATLRSRFPE